MTDLRFPNQDLRNKDYKDVAAGDETHRYGDYIPREAAEELAVGELFALNGEGLAVAYDPETAGQDELAGVVYTNTNDEIGPTHQPEDDAVVEEGEVFTAKVQGTVVAHDPAEDITVGERTEEGALGLDRGGEDDEFVHVLLP